MLSKLMEAQYTMDNLHRSALAFTFRKSSFFLRLAAKSLLPIAGFIGLSKGLTTEGSTKEKIMSGVQEAGNQIFNPANAVSNTLIWSAPGTALKWAGAPGAVTFAGGMYGGMKASEMMAPVLNQEGGVSEGVDDVNPFSLG